MCHYFVVLRVKAGLHCYMH